MKKIFLFSLMGVVIVCRAFGQGSKDCSRTFTWWSNDWNAGSNEYLFKTEYDYLATVNNGHFYKCGDQCADCCRGDSYIKMKSGHVFQGFVVNEDRYYKCKTRGNNQWQQIDASATSGLVLCSNEAKIGNGTFRNEEAKRYLFPTKNDYDHMKHNTSGAVYECDKQNCTFGTIVTMPAGHYFGRNKINTQRKYKCQNGDFWDDITDDCPDCNKQESKPVEVESETKNTEQKLPTPRKKTSSAETSSSVDCSQYAKGTEAYKCCTYTDNDGADWVNGQCVCRRRSLCGTRLHWNGNGCLPSEEALKKVGEKHACENTDVAKWYEQGDVCRCDCPAGQNWVFDESKAVDYELGLVTNDPQTGQRKSWDYALWKPLIENPGKCVSDGDDGSVTPIPSDDKVCYYDFVGDVKCANGNSYNINKKIPVNNTSGMNCKTFLQSYGADRNNILKIEQEICANPGGYVVISYGPTQAQVNEARNKISSFFNTAESTASVWKDAEGKFNTARLASDLTAGVVLGTVGGVVSGVVIKKKQVEKGFEALHCTVGGQKIADWGDTFQVGLQ